MTNIETPDLYFELFKRNQPIIPLSTQEKIKQFRVLIAGCGSTGGAFIEGASRVGVIHFKLVEPDHFELHNLNRQFVYPKDLGVNKATVHANRLNDLFKNCAAEIETNTQGVNSVNIDQLTENIDLVFDAVDVTTPSGIAAKLLLHEMAFKKKLLVFSALDLGYKQWIRIFNYSSSEAKLLDGRMQLTRSIKHPLKALITGFCPLEELSFEVLEELIRLLKAPQSGACQIASSCHLLSSFAGPLIQRIVEKKYISNVITFDLMRHLEDENEKVTSQIKTKNLRLEAQELLEKLE